MRPLLLLLLLGPALAGCTDTGPAPTLPDGPGPPTAPPPAGDGTPPNATPPNATPPAGDARIALRPFLSGLDQPVFVTHAGDGSGRLFVVEQTGRIRVAEDGALREAPFLDIASLVRAAGEQGFLGLAFEPGFAEHGRFYVHYSDTRGDTVLARYRASGADASRADPASARVLLQVDQPYANHNGGMLAFGPDGMLYMALGDGGSGGDPQGNGQKLDTLLGKLLRLDVRGEGDYAIPPDNPFAGGGGRGEVWAYGLRNPWRFSFDRATGDLYLGDVGQNTQEEVDFQRAGSPGGANYGWNWWEGTHRFRSGDAPPTVAPIATYPIADGNCAVTGGYVYRGEAIPGLRGEYVFGDYCSGRIWGLRNEGSQWRMRALLDTEHRITSFGEDEAGELYVVDHGGEVQRVVAG